MKSSLPPPVQDALERADLLDPTTFAKEEQDDTIGAIAAGAALVFLLPLFEAGFINDVIFSTLAGGGAAAYAALRKDQVGTFTRSVTGRLAKKAATTTYEKVLEVEEEYQVTQKVKDKAVEVAKDVTAELKKKL